MMFLFSIAIAMITYSIKSSLMYVALYFANKKEEEKRILFKNIESTLGVISLFFTLSTFVTAAYYFSPYFQQFM